MAKKPATTSKKPAKDTKAKKAPVSYREQANKNREKARKPRKLKSTAGFIKKPISALIKLLKAIAKPFSFLLIPFKTRPARFIGRVLSKIFFVNYFVGSWKELKNVTWPNRRETFKLTVAVITFALVFGVFITLVDFLLDKLFRGVLL